MIRVGRRWNFEVFVFCIFWGDFKAALRLAQGERNFSSMEFSVRAELVEALCNQLEA